MPRSRSRFVMAASLGMAAAMSLSIISANAAAPQLAQTGPGTVLTDDQKAQLKASLENFSPEDVKQAALDIVTGIEQYIHGVATEGTQGQKDRLAARVHRAFVVWRDQHGDTPARGDLEQLLTRIAEEGVAVNVIVPEVQKAREAAAAGPPVLTDDQKAQLKASLENFSPGDVKQAALDIVTGIEQYIYGVETKGTEEQKARLDARVHRAFVVWRKEHGDTPVRDDLEQLLTRIAEEGVAVDVIVPGVQTAREAAAARPPSSPQEHPAAAVTHHR